MFVSRWSPPNTFAPTDQLLPRADVVQIRASCVPVIKMRYPDTFPVQYSQLLLAVLLNCTIFTKVCGAPLEGRLHLLHYFYRTSCRSIANLRCMHGNRQAHNLAMYRREKVKRDIWARRSSKCTGRVGRGFQRAQRTSPKASGLAGSVCWRALVFGLGFIPSVTSRTNWTGLCVERCHAPPHK